MFKSTAIALAVVASAAPALAEMSDEQQVLNAINNVGYFADQGNWDQVAEQFHPDGAVLD